MTTPNPYTLENLLTELVTLRVTIDKHLRAITAELSSMNRVSPTPPKPRPKPRKRD